MHTTSRTLMASPTIKELIQLAHILQPVIITVQETQLTTTPKTPNMLKLTTIDSSPNKKLGLLTYIHLAKQTHTHYRTINDQNPYY